jgi:hypothetical protein
MPDCVLDASVVGLTNEQIPGPQAGEAFGRRLAVIKQVVSGASRARYNPKLLGEYVRLARVRRNDVIELFFAVLDSGRAVFVKRNSLPRQHHATARGCGWPTHDEHLLAAALDGDRCCVFVTEEYLGRCGPRVYAVFGIRIEHLD